MLEHSSTDKVGCDFFPLSIEADRVRPITPEYGLLRGECWTTVPLPPPSRSIKPAIYGHSLNRPAAVPHLSPQSLTLGRPAANEYFSIKNNSLSSPVIVSQRLPDSTGRVASIRMYVFNAGRRINSFRASGCGPTVHAPDSSSNLKPIFCKPTNAVLPYSSSISLAKLGA